MESDKHIENNPNTDGDAEEANDPLIYGVKLSEIKEIADRRMQPQKQLYRQSSFFNTSIQEDSKDDSFRGKSSRIIHSFKFQAVVIGFVILDCIFVIAELVVDLRITKEEVCDKITCAAVKKDHSLSLILQSLSLGILSLFMIELVFKLYVMRLKFFQSKMEIFDAVIVVVSWSLDVVFFEHGDGTDAITMLIFLRMWRLIRIVHAIAVSMITPIAHQLEQEEHAHHVTEVTLEKLTEYTTELEQEIKELREMISQNRLNSKGSLPITKVRRKLSKMSKS